MKTYSTRGWWTLAPEREDIEGKPSSMTVYAAEPESRPTGILNAEGLMIYVREEPNPIGFTAKIDGR